METIMRDRRAVLVFVGPALLIYTIIVLVPIVWSVVYTVMEGNVVGGFQFVGLHNFFTLIRDPSFWQAFFFTVKYAVIVTAGQVGIGLLLALLYTFYLRKSSNLIRTLIFFPLILPTVAVAELFSKMFEITPQYGLVNSLLHIGHLDAWVQPWLGQGGTAFLVIVIMDIWRAIGFYGVLLYAGLVDIPTDILEGARIDGAAGWRLVRYVVLPLLTPILFSALIFSLTGTLKVFDSILALTNGGPGQATTPLTISMFTTAFANGQYGYGSTIAIALAIMSLLVTLAIFRSARRDVA